MRRLLAAALSYACVSLAAAPALARNPRALTCNERDLDPTSYRLTTDAYARNVTEPRYRWWDAYDTGKHAADLDDLNDSAIGIAERARTLDDRNLMAHAHLARQYVIAGVDARTAHDEWRRTLDAGGAVVWTATLYDVDGRSYFVVTFDRQGIRIYRFGQFAAPLQTRLGVPEFPGPERPELWRALGGCVPESVVPEAAIPWSDVRELKAGNWVVWFTLDRRVSIGSDRGKRKTLDEIKVNLHGATGDVEYRWNWDPYRGVENLRGIGHGPAAYQERVRYTLVQLFDPSRRIRLPKQSRGAGW